jgi:hypothetical protein
MQIKFGGKFFCQKSNKICQKITSYEGNINIGLVV